MQGIYGGSFHIRVVQLPFCVGASKATERIIGGGFSWPSFLARSCREAVSFSSAPVLLLRRLHDEVDRSRRHEESHLYLKQKHRTFRIVSASFQVWSKITRTTLAFKPIRQPAAAKTMTTVSVAAHEGGRQLRRRKEAHISVSTTQMSTASVMDSIGSKQPSSRKKSAKSAVATLPTDDDVEVDNNSSGEALATDLEARLWNLEKSDQLTTLTVVELRGLMKHISKPTAGRKEELISEVKKWLAERQASASRQTKLDAIRATRESSSDAESLEGALLKAESKSRQSEAISRMTEPSAGTDLHETLTERKPLNKDSETFIGEGKSLANGKGIPASKLPRGAAQKKKAENSQDASQLENNPDEDVEPSVEEEVNVVKSRAPRKGTKIEKQVEKTVVEEGSVKASATGQKRKARVSKTTQTKKVKVTEEEEELESAIGVKEPWTMLIHKKPQPDWVAYNPETMRPAPPPNGAKTVKLLSWNVNGLRALIKDKDKKVQEALLLTKLAMEEEFDVLCLQETKLQEKDVEQIKNTLLAGYDDSFWSCSTSKLGYSGTAVLSRVKPISVKYGMEIVDHDAEGRLITVEFETFFLLSAYVPNAGEKLVRLTYRTKEWDPALSAYIKELEREKPVILTGDLNCSNEEIDIHNPDGNRKSAGFTEEERSSFKANFLNQGLVDTFRRQHTNAVGYTYWGYRSGARPKNQGWRLDYFLVSEALVERVHDSYTLPDVLGSDHCPIGLILNL